MNGHIFSIRGWNIFFIRTSFNHILNYRMPLLPSITITKTIQIKTALRMTHRSNGNFVRNSVFKIKIIHWKLSFVNSKHNKIIFGKNFSTYVKQKYRFLFPYFEGLFSSLLSKSVSTLILLTFVINCEQSHDWIPYGITFSKICLSKYFPDLNCIWCKGAGWHLRISWKAVLIGIKI